MRLAKKPPVGAGKVQRITKTDTLLAHIEGLGLDKFMNPIGIRTLALAEATGVPANSISVLLAPHVASGRLCTCKVTVPGSPAQNEYRKGAGATAPKFQPLDTRRTGVALRTPARAGAPAVPLSTPKPGATEIEPATLGKPQPAVGATTPAAGNPEPPSKVEPAVAAAPATPKPTAGVRLNKEPTTPKASAGDALSINIDHDGTLIIATDEAVIELQQSQSRRLGNFMLGSQGIWNPF
jgi:hypothetical protein